LLDTITYYIALYEARNFRKCAEKLCMQPSTLSKYITELEKELNQLLIVRTSRRFEITEFGEYIYNQFKHIPSFIESTIDTYNKRISRSSQHGELNVALGPDISYEIVSPYIGAFMIENPNIRLNLSYIPYVSMLPSSNISLILTVMHINDDSLERRFVRKDYFRLYCSSDYVMQNGLPSSVHELAKHKIIGFVAHDFMPIEYHKLKNIYTNEEYVLDFRENQLNANNGLQMKQIGLHSDYIFPSCDSLVSEELIKGKIVGVLPDWIVRENEIYIVSKKRVTAIEQLFIDFIHKCFGRINSNVSGS
jgi:DNA-binding transcriptional LysR family regulator